MSKSNSNLLNYINLLMHHDDALHQFLADPIQAEEKHGITKAERAVLRRTVAHLSNNSKNGYSVARQLGSYRRSLRLLQNVLHHVGSKMIQDATAQVTSDDDADSYQYSLIVYYPNVSKDTDFTEMTNSDVQDDYGGPYANNTEVYTVNLTSDDSDDPANATIQDVLNALKDDISYSTVEIDDSDYVLSIQPPDSYKISADLSEYSLSDDYVFWFYTINGLANKSGVSGDAGASFADYKLNPNDTVCWQLIAPDAEYGYLPCD